MSSRQQQLGKRLPRCRGEAKQRGSRLSQPGPAQLAAGPCDRWERHAASGPQGTASRSDGGVELLNLGCILVKDDLPPGLHGAGERAVLGREWLLEDDQRCDGVLGWPLCSGLVDLGPQQVMHLLVAHLACKPKEDTVASSVIIFCDHLRAEAAKLEISFPPAKETRGKAALSSPKAPTKAAGKVLKPALIACMHSCRASFYLLDSSARISMHGPD